MHGVDARSVMLQEPIIRTSITDCAEEAGMQSSLFCKPTPTEENQLNDCQDKQLSLPCSIYDSTKTGHALCFAKGLRSTKARALIDRLNPLSPGSH